MNNIANLETLKSPSATRLDFPILQQKIYKNKSLVYLDNAATSQKPQCVIDALVNYYSQYNANIHRGVHYLSQKASQAYDNVRVKCANFVNANSEREIIFVRGTTEGINLVAATYGRQHIMAGDEIVLTQMEHHSNIVPWQMLAAEKKATIKYIPVLDNGELDIEAGIRMINERTKIVSVVHTSNSLGTCNDIEKIIAHAHNMGAKVLIDGAQAAAHQPIDVKKWDCDFFACSSHKMCGPTGVGILYVKQDILEHMSPYQGGGDMIRQVTENGTTYNDIPFRFEAGTQNIADVIAMGAAIDYYKTLDRQACIAHEQQMMKYVSEELLKIERVSLIGTAPHKTSVVSFIMKDANALDVGMYLDTLGIAVRTGQHCTEPLMARFKISGTIRASFMFYNTMDEAQALIQGVAAAGRLL